LGVNGAKTLDLVVVGAGILGLATARELLRRHPRLRLAVIDRETDVAAHQTAHNSGVIHAGIYYAPGSLKARLCVEGAARLYSYCEENGIPVQRCGKLIVAADESELPRLDALEQRGIANGVHGLRRLRAREIAEIEPHCTGVAALHSPNTGIVDFAAIARRLADEIREAGGEIMLGRGVIDVRSRSGAVDLDYGTGSLSASHAVFCAGAWSDRLAARAGVELDLRIVPFRGQYLSLRPQARHLVSGLIYPVPDPALPFLGVHLTRHISGTVLLGPTALLVGARDGYRLRDARAADLWSSVAWPGTWRMMRRYWRAGLGEMVLASSRRAFVRACARFVPELSIDDVEGGPAGVRAQAVLRGGRLVDDFVFGSAGRSLHVLNAPSPAATSSLAIASVVADRAADTFELGTGAIAVPAGGRSESQGAG
jgi:(S)-2-hydroxyglutarate dehydrogenase